MDSPQVQEWTTWEVLFQGRDVDWLPVSRFRVEDERHASGYRSLTGFCKSEQEGWFALENFRDQYPKLQPSKLVRVEHVVTRTQIST